MALDAQAGGAAMAQKIADQVARETPLSPTAMAQQLAAAYRDYSRAATLPGADMTAGGDVSLLEDAFLVEDSSAQVSRLAAGLCAYWATCGVPGVPAHGGTSVQSVVITTAGHVSAMEAAIRALVTDEEVPDAFAVFYQATQDVVQLFPCTVVEIIPGSPPAPVPFPEFIA